MPIEDNLESTKKYRETAKISIIQRQPFLTIGNFPSSFFFFFSGFVFSKWQRTYCKYSNSWLSYLTFSYTHVTVYILIKAAPFHSSPYQHLQGPMVPWDLITLVRISVKAYRGRSLHLLSPFPAMPQASRYHLKIYIHLSCQKSLKSNGKRRALPVALGSSPALVTIYFNTQVFSFRTC